MRLTMFHYLHLSDYLSVLVCFTLYWLGWFYIRFPHLRSVRFWCAFRIGRDVILAFCLPSLRWYFYIWWTLEMINLSWIAYISGHMCSLQNPFIRRSIWQKVPFLGVVALCAINFPPHSTNQMIRWLMVCSFICLATIVTGTYLFIHQRYVNFAHALTFGLLVTFCHIELWLQFNVFLPLLWNLTWVGVSLGILAAALKLSVRSYTPPPVSIGQHG